jgi:hypothetical protein
MTAKTLIAITSGLVILALFAFSAQHSAMRIYRSFTPYSNFQVTGPVILSDKWLDVELKPPLEQNRKRQFIVFVLADQFLRQDPSKEPQLQNGTVVNFEAELVDENGKTYRLTEPFGDGYSEVGRGFPVRTELSASTRFPRVRLRTNVPIKCSKIIWRAYDPRDFK